MLYFVYHVYLVRNDFFFKIAKISNMLAIYTGDVLCYRYWSLPGETVTENYTTGKIPHHPRAQKGDHGN